MNFKVWLAQVVEEKICLLGGDVKQESFWEEGYVSAKRRGEFSVFKFVVLIQGEKIAHQAVL